MKSIQEIISERNPDALVRIDEFISKNGESLEEILIKSRVLDEKEVLEVLSEFYEFPYTLTISEREIDPELVKITPHQLRKKIQTHSVPEEERKSHDNPCAAARPLCHR